MDRYITLWDVMPRISDKSEIVAQVELVKEFLVDHGRTICSPDEAIFLATLERTIDILKKAKSMVGDSKFSVLYRGAEINDNPSVSDFEIIPIRPAKHDRP